MNDKMTNNTMTNNTYQQLNLKTKLSKQAEQEQNGDHLEGYQLGGLGVE